MVTMKIWKSNKPKLVREPSGIYRCYNWEYWGVGHTPEEAYGWWRRFVDNFEKRIPYSDFHETMHHLLWHEMMASVLPDEDLKKYFP